MSNNKTFLQIAEETLSKINRPMGQKEIWEQAVKTGVIGKDDHPNAKTPWASVGAQIYLDIRDNEKTKFQQVSNRPQLFCLKNCVVNEKEDLYPKEKEKKITFKERDLHPLLVSYIGKSQDFKACAKTIYHEKSSKGRKGLNKWLHPDIVGVYFPFEDLTPETRETIKSLSANFTRIFSFELKTNISLSNLRESYFQAVSNSSWANEGYLVSLEISEEQELFEEIRRLNNAFGIGLIKLNVDNIDESEILFPSRVKESLDWITIDRLSTENEDFRDFLNSVNEDFKVQKIKSNYDKIMNEEELNGYIKNMKICKETSL